MRSALLRSCLVLLLVPVAATRGQDPEPRLIPRATLFAPTERSQVHLSPAGDAVGYLAPHDGRTRLWIAPIDDPSAARPVTGADLAPVVTWRWSARDDIVLIEPAHPGGRRVVALDVAAGIARDLTAPGGSGRVLRVSAGQPDTIAVLSSGGDDPPRLERVAIDGSTRATIADAGPYVAWYLDDTLALRAARRSVGDGMAVDRRTADGVWHEIATYDWEDTRACGVMGVAADGSEVYLTRRGERDTAALLAVDVETGAERVVATDPAADILYAGATLDPATGAPQAVVAYFARLRRQVLDPSVDVDFEVLATHLRGDVSFVGRSRDDRRWLVRDMHGGPFDYHLYDRPTRTLRRLFSDLPALDAYRLAARHHVVVPARDGLALPCDLYLPPGVDGDADGIPDRPLPTVMYMHGGPWVGYLWNSWFANRSLQLLANRGYAVLRVEFRGANGLGRAFIDAGDLQWGEAMQTDLVDIAAWAVRRGIAEPDRVGLWGWSYGGYATNAALCFHPDAFACGVSMYGLSDLLSFTEGLIARGGGDLWQRRVGDPTTDEGRALLRRHSPVNHADRVTRPIFVTHGARDDRAPKEQSDVFVDALEAAGKAVTYVVYPDEPHDYRADESWISFWAMAEAFLAEHLGGRAEPIAGDLAGARFEVITGGELIRGLDAALAATPDHSPDGSG